MEADTKDFPYQHAQESTITNENPSSNFQDHGNQRISFSQRLKDIDKDLGIYDNPLNLAQAENAPIREGNSPPFDLGLLGKELEDDNSLSHAPTLVPPLQRNQTFPFQEITNTPKLIKGHSHSQSSHLETLPQNCSWTSSLFAGPYWLQTTF